MSGKPKLSAAYFDAQEVISGKQDKECEVFGRAILSLITNRCAVKLGDDECDEMKLELEFKVRPQLRAASDPCLRVSIQADEDLDKKVVERLAATHIET